MTNFTFEVFFMKYAEYIEKERRGSPEFPIQYYFVDKSSKRYTMKAHWHPDFEIIRVLEGEISVYLNSVEYVMKKGDVVFVECGALHRADPENVVYEVVVIDLNMLKRQQNDALQKFLHPVINSEVGISPKMKKGDVEIEEAVLRLFEIMRDAPTYYELGVFGELFTLFFLLYKNGYIVSASGQPHNRQAKSVTEILNWVEENYTEDITLEKIAALTGLSEKYICRIFKEYTSKTLVNYINEMRVERAAFDIRNKGKNITAAAFDSGFNDLSYFCKIFKRYKGMTPKEYKKAKENRKS